MSGIGVGLVIFAVMLALMVVRVPIGIAMFIVGFGGYVYLTGGNVNALLNSLKNLAYARLSNYDLVVIPLFLLMGQFATHGGLSKALFRFVGAFIGHRKGGVAMAAIGACAGFGAICGSSVATAATMGQVALPELRRFGYSGCARDRRARRRRHARHHDPAVGAARDLRDPHPGVDRQAVHGGGAARHHRDAGVHARGQDHRHAASPTPAPPARAWRGPSASSRLLQVLPVLLVFLVVIVGIYGGWANPTEAAAIGAAACGGIAIISGGMRGRGLIDSALGTAQATAMIFLVLLGADMMNTTLALSQMPVELANWVKASGLPPLLVMVMILLIYIFLGCVMDALAMILLTIPIFYPMVMALDYWGMNAVGQVDLVRHPRADGGRDRARPSAGRD